MIHIYSITTRISNVLFLVLQLFSERVDRVDVCDCRNVNAL